MSEPEKTREVFGDYVSVYDFKQSIEDGATVPLFYENHIPELQLTNEDLNEELTEIRDFEANDLDIKKHRLRIEKEPLDEMFKDNDNPLRLVFVCVMWITGSMCPVCPRSTSTSR